MMLSPLLAQVQPSSLLRIESLQVQSGSSVLCTFSDLGTGATNYLLEFADRFSSAASWSTAASATLTDLGAGQFEVMAPDPQTDQGYYRIRALGGTRPSFIRNERLGMIAHPERPDRIKDELTHYSTRHWFYTPGAGTAIQNAESKSVTIQYLKSASSRLQGNPQDVLPELNEVLKINAFRERAVAASQWVLEIATSDGGVQLLDLDNVHDIEFGFVHNAAERPQF